MSAAASAVLLDFDAAGETAVATEVSAAAAGAAGVQAWRADASHAGPSWRLYRRFSSSGGVAVVASARQGLWQV